MTPASNRNGAMIKENAEDSLHDVHMLGIVFEMVENAGKGEIVVARIFSISHSVFKWTFSL